jgi:hypothetical protein
MTAGFSASRVTEFSQTHRPNGYDLVLAFAFDRPDGSSQEWRWSGQFFNRDRGIEWTAELTLSGAMAALSPSQIPQRIHAAIEYGEPQGDFRGGRVEITTTYQDGREERRVETRLFPATPREEMAPHDYLDAFRQIFERQPFLGQFQDLQPNHGD